MSLTVFDGLPTHVLLVHFVVVLVPLTALALVVCAVWPQGARRLGLVLPLLALVTLAFVPFTTNAGEWLRDRIGHTPPVNRHADLGDGLLPWVVSVLAVSAAVWWVTRRETVAETRRTTAAEGGPERRLPAHLWPSLPLRPRVLRVLVAVLAFAAAAGSVAQVYRVGDSGAEAAWQGVVSGSGGTGGAGDAGDARGAGGAAGDGRTGPGAVSGRGAPHDG
ncbi:hypothetical protein GCM10018793_15940 [Streptomyces sulfonofaciens]|uniref:Uncharacterized protein n=1 Tax=Streptomyces sulfonofaciens TaxID=68272 RepID=A0A919FZK3_9ACTN|nr:DUF2231 domain-containing protein [Streptomyces sulfonofaciens]GHH74520.1 hypothetical protein GCM10018793_15940 [Streptomyces sulfonofaciens]